MGEWKLANSKKPEGLLDKSSKFLGTKNLVTSHVIIPDTMDAKSAVLSLAGIVSAGVRSFEIWWDSHRQSLDIVIVATEPDLDKFKQSITNAYPNADFEDMDETVPDWFDQEEKLQGL